MAKFKNMRWLEGRELKICGGVDLYAVPERVVVLEDNQRTILTELTFKKSEFGIDMPPRKIKYSFDKAKIACGALQLKLKDSGEMIERSDVLEYCDEGYSI